MADWVKHNTEDLRRPADLGSNPRAFANNLTAYSHNE